MKVTFSIIVPIYKVEEYLKKCVDSILAQTFKDFELILVDDGSPDNCPKICDEYQKKDSRVQVVHKKNEGLVKARNTGLQKATGEFICYVDGDDWISKDLLQTVYNKAIKKYHPDMVIFNATRQYKDRQEEISKGPEEGYYNKKALKEQIYPYMMYDSRRPFCNGLIFPVAWNKIYKRKLLLHHFCKDGRIRMGEDNAFVYECLYFANSVYVCNDILYYYNQLNVGSMTNTYDADRFKNNRYLVDYIEKNLSGKDKVLDNQINAFKAYWLIMAVFHEIKTKQPILKATKHIKINIKKYKSVKSIKMKGLPITARIFIGLLKAKLIFLSVIAATIVNKKRNAN